MRHPESPTPSLKVSALTDVGLSRAGNEDAFLVDTIDKPGGQLVILAVCDGMGGHAAGEVASNATAEVLAAHLRRAPFTARPDETAAELVTAVKVADRLVFEAGNREAALRGMGTTLTAAAIVGETVLIAEVGDSRAYLFREGELVQLTRDQTLVAQMIENGQLDPESAATFDLGNIILQAVGTSGEVQVDLTVLGACRGDLLLLSSDGLHGKVPDATLRQVLAGPGTLGEKCRALIEHANGAGGDDNITCVLALLDDARLPTPAGKKAKYEKYVWPESPRPETEPKASTSLPPITVRPRRGPRAALALLVVGALAALFFLFRA